MRECCLTNREKRRHITNTLYVRIENICSHAHKFSIAKSQAGNVNCIIPSVHDNVIIHRECENIEVCC